MKRLGLLLFSLCSAQFNINEILYESIKGAIGDGFLLTNVLKLDFYIKLEHLIIRQHPKHRQCCAG